MFPKRSSLSKNKNKESKFDNFTIEDENSNIQLATVNSDIEKLYKKYSKIKKKRLSEEKTQQILVNRIKYLKNEFKRSISKNDKKMKNNPKNIKIEVKVEENYEKNKKEKKYKNKSKTNKNHIFNYDNESISRTSFNESESIGSNRKDVKLKNNNTLINNTENNPNLCNSINNIKNLGNILRRNKYNIGNNNSNNNIYIIINNPKNFGSENSLNNHLANNIINYNFDNNMIEKKNTHSYKNNRNTFHQKHKSENNFFNLSQRGENYILMKADTNKLKDILNSINDINNNKDGVINNENKIKKLKRQEQIKKEVNLTDRSEISKKITTRNPNNDLLDNEEKNGEYIRPNFLNLYNNEDTSILKQQIDINTFNKTDNSFLKTTESFLKNNFITDKSGEEYNNDINKIKQKNKKSGIFQDVINNKNMYNINEINNFMYNTAQSINYSPSESNIQIRNKNYINSNKTNEITSKKDINNICRLNNNNKYMSKNKLNSNDKYNSNRAIQNKNTNCNKNKLKIIKPDKSKESHIRSDSFNNSIENKRRFLGLEFKPNIKRELSIQTEHNSEKRNKFLQKVKSGTKFNGLIEKNKLIKVKKREAKKKIINREKENYKNKSVSSLLKYKTMTNLNRVKRNLNFLSKNEENKEFGKKMNYHIYI